MPFKIVIRHANDGYRIIAENDGNFEEWVLFHHTDWDAIKAQRDQLSRLFECDIQLVTPHAAQKVAAAIAQGLQLRRPRGHRKNCKCPRCSRINAKVAELSRGNLATGEACSTG